MVKIDIEKLALLARIKLAPKEKEKLQKEFEEILNYVSKLKEIDIEGIGDKEASETINLENVMRDDENFHKAGEFSEDLLKEMPRAEKGYAKVKHILK
jgi:aspartyl-tRNA(Asn)/glutamyl-tRNA(Gln) amidotransferase subunit C